MNNVSVLIVTHPQIGTAFINTVRNTYGKDKELPLNISSLEVKPDISLEQTIFELKQRVEQLHKHSSGILILTDLFGATPTNIAQELLSEKTRIVSGLNLGMLLRVMNYPQSNLDQLVAYALQGGQAGILQCECKSKVP